MHSSPVHKNKPGFTLLELLVVIAVLGILMAILIPVMQSFHEKSQRAVCASNQRQLINGMLGTAAGQGGLLPRTPRYGPNTTSDHMSWVPTSLVRQMSDDFGMNLVTFTCPNRGEDYIWDPQPNNRNSHAMRVGYYFLFGRKDHWPARPGRGQAGWIATLRIANIRRPAAVPAISDVIEKDTVHTPDGRRQRNSSTSHTARGAKLVFGSHKPDSYGGKGGNVGFFDGSVRWVNQKDMIAYPASNRGGVTGYWPPLPAELKP